MASLNVSLKCHLTSIISRLCGYHITELSLGCELNHMERKIDTTTHHPAGVKLQQKHMADWGADECISS